MTQIGTAFLKVLLETGALERDLAKTKGSILKWGKSLAKAGAAGAAIGVAADFLVDSVKAAQEAQVVQQQLERQVEATGLSYEKYQDQIDETITATSNLAAVDDEELSKSFTKLVGSTGDVEDALAGMQAATDVAAARGVSLESATKAIEKAMNGSVAGLKRFGVQLDKNASRQEVLEALQKRFGGAAEAYGKTAAGAQERFGIALENVKEQIGTALLPAVTKFFDAVSKGLVWWQANWPQIQKAIADTYRLVKPILDSLVTQIRFVAVVILDVAKVIAALVRGDWGAAWRALKDLAVDTLKGLITVIENLPIVKALRFLIDKALEALRSAAAEVGRAAGKIGDAIVDGITAYLNFYVTIGKTIVDQLGKAATYVVQNVGAGLAKIAQAIIAHVARVGDLYLTVGKAIVNGLIAAGTYVANNLGNPFSAVFSKLKSLITAGVADLIDWIKRKFSGIPGAIGGALGKLNPFSATPPSTAAPAAAAGTGGGASAGVRASGGGGGTMGSGSGFGALRLPGLGGTLPSLGGVGAIQVSVFIGDEPLRGMIRTEVVRSDTGLARSVLAGTQRL